MSTFGDFLSSILEAVKFRVTTSIVATYLFFWAALHWQGIYTTLFVSQDHIFDKFGLLKNEYVNQYFFGFRPLDLSFWAGYVVPAIATWLFVWILPKALFLRAFRQERWYKMERKLILLEDNRRYEKQKEAGAKQKTRRAKAEVAAAKAEKQVVETDPTKVFDRQYVEFMRRPGARQAMQDLIECMYEQNGRLKRENTYGVTYQLDSKSLAMLHANELVEIQPASNGGTIELTTKGRYFASKFA